jgi:hypothetical protein
MTLNPRVNPIATPANGAILKFLDVVVANYLTNFFFANYLTPIPKYVLNLRLLSVGLRSHAALSLTVLVLCYAMIVLLPFCFPVQDHR